MRSFVLALVLAALPIAAHGARTVIPPTLAATEINRLLNRAVPGDTFQFGEGVYGGRYFLRGVHGQPDRPVVIRGLPGKGGFPTLIDGRSEPGMGKEEYAFHLQGSSWIVIEHMEIRNCWTDLIRAEDVSYLSVRHCSMFGGKRALFATGRGSHHFLMEHCRWEQDERVWTHAEGYTWEEVHHGVHEHYNGSLFQGSGISGSFVLRDNHIRNTFNAFRLSRIDGGEMDLLACTNGEICRNTVENTSDNVLEPEVHVRNLHFYHNRMINGHAFVSITEVAGGEVYIYGNTAVQLPGSEDGWTVFKISQNNRSLDGPLFIFNNSWQVGFDMIGSPRRVWSNNHLRHFNNACFSEAGDTFGIYHLGEDNRFDYDCSNLPFPSLLTARGMESNGLVADPLFRDPYRGDFRLREGSPCFDRGTVLEGLHLNWRGKLPDIGAYDNDTLVEGPPFRFVPPGTEISYLERPRITRHRVQGRELHLWFSAPMDPHSLELVFPLLANEKESERIPLELKQVSEEGYRVTLAARQSISPGFDRLSFARWPRGTNGMEVTSWASALPVTLTRATPVESASRALETTRAIAHKIMRETLFEYELVPFTYNAGVSHLRITDPGHEKAVWFARSVIRSRIDTSGILGFSFTGKATLWLNGEEIFRGISSDAPIKEYTYNRFRFPHRLPVRWKEGENEVLVRFDPAGFPSGILMMPLDELDAFPEFLEQVPAMPGEAGVDWITCGPWPVPEDPAVSLPPEGAFRPRYEYDGETFGWKVQPLEMVRELKIPETSSYRRDSYADWHYANGGTLFGILGLHEVTGDDRYLEFARDYMENLAANKEYFRKQYRQLHTMRGSFHRIYRKSMLDDTGGPAIPLAVLTAKEVRFDGLRPLLDTVLEYVTREQERLPDGTLSRPEPEPATVWADDLFMSVPFLLRMAAVTGDETLYGEVAAQVIRFNRHLADPETGLYFHGWYHTRLEHTPVRWGRANGWVAWATSEALLHLPQDHPQYDRVLEIFRQHMKALAGYQDASGLWHQVPDHPDTWLETSCTAMFTLAMARGARMGWLDDSYREMALKGWEGLQSKVGSDGTVKDICRGTGIGETVEFYAARSRFDHDPRGLGAMLTAGCEIHLLTINHLNEK